MEIRVKAILLFFGILLCVGSCSPFTTQIRKEANPNANLAAITAAPQNFTGETVIFGGQILNTQVKPGESILEILQFPLDYRDRPKLGSESQGRFLAVFTEYLDPAIYAQGRLITVIGRVIGTRQGSVGQVQYTYPLLSVKSAHLWEVEDYHTPAVTFGIGIGTYF